VEVVTVAFIKQQPVFFNSLMMVVTVLWYCSKCFLLNVCFLVYWCLVLFFLLLHIKKC